jgi:hypothetical protein
MGNFLKHVNKKNEEDKKKSSSVSTNDLRERLQGNKTDFFTSAPYKNEEDEKKKSTGGKFGKYAMEKSIGFDTFQSDLSSMGKTISNIYNGWQNEETMKNTRSSIEAMQKRINAYQEYQKIYGGADLSDIASGYSSLLENFDERTKIYGDYKNAEEYSAAMKLAKEEAERRASMPKADLNAVQSEIDRLEGLKESEYFSEAEKYRKLRNATKNASGRNGFVYDPKTSPLEAKYNTATENLNKFLADEGFENVEALQKAIVEKTQYKNQAKVVQDRISLEKEIREDADFDKYVSLGEALGDEREDGWLVPDNKRKNTVAYLRNNPEAMEQFEESAKSANGASFGTAERVITQGSLEYKAAKYGTDEQLKNYYAYLGKGDTENAKRYLEAIEEDLNYAMGESKANEQDTTAKRLLYSITAGLDQFEQNTINAFNTSDDYIPYSPTQVASGMVRDELDDVGFDILGKSIGQIGYDLGTTTANMAPSILASSVVGMLNPGLGAVVGAGTMGLSASGGAYQQKLNEGWDKGQARVYATAIGISEGALQYALGGIGNLGGKLTGKSITAMATGIDNALVRYITTMGIKMSSEGIEESLQEVIAPFIENLALGYAKNNWSDVELQEVAYSGLLGALSAFGLEGGSTAVNVFGENRKAKGIGATVRSNEQLADVFDIASLTPQESDAYNLYTQYAKKGVNAENASDLQLGRLFLNSDKASQEVLASKKATLTQRDDAIAMQKRLSNISKENALDENTRQSIEESVGVSKTYRDGLIETGLESAENTESHKLAVELKARVKNGEDISSKDLAKLAKANDNAIKLEEYAQTMSEEDSGVFIEQYDGTTDIEEYHSNFTYVNTLADNAVDVDEALAKVTALTPSQVGAIYNAKILASDAKPLQVALDNLKAKHKGSAFIEGSINDVVIDYRNGTTDGSKVNWKDLTSRQKKAIRFAKAFAKATGVNIIFTKSKVVNGEHKGENGSYNPETNTITLDVYAGRIDATTTKDAIIPTLSHELTHWMKNKAPELYKAISENVMQTLVASGQLSKNELIANEIDRIKKKHGKEVSSEYAMDEIVARACEDMLSNSNQARKLLAKMSVEEQQTFVGKVKESLENLIGWVNELLEYYSSESAEAKTLREYKKDLKAISKMWDEMLVSSIEANQALQQEGITGEQLAKADADVQYAIREEFVNEIDEWKKDGKPDGESFILGTTGDVLQGLGAIESDIYMLGDKIKEILNDHPEITIDEIKKIPQILDEPVLVLKSKKITSRLVMFGSVKAQNGKPILVVLDLRPYENGFMLNDMQKVNSAYTKTETFNKTAEENGRDFVKNSEILYVDKKRTTYLLSAIGFYMPITCNQSGYIGSITYEGDNVNIKGEEFSKVFEENAIQNSDRDSSGRELTKEQVEYFKDSNVRDEDGNLLVMYRGDSSEFTVFDRKKSKYSNLYGRGFYFTSSKAHAEQYGNAREFYLDIKNPLIQKQNNITKKQMLNFLKAIENDGEDYDLYNYGQDATAESGLASVWGKGDYEMLQDINAGAIGDLVAAVELFNEVNGTTYDGIILPTETITFKSEQAKLTSNKTPTDNEDIRFSMRESVEETKELVAVHNMQVSELERTLDLGGLPMPSIAIIKAKTGHSEYGDVSLVFPKSTIDPKANANNKVYGGDAWTPVYPTIEYKPNAKNEKKISDKYYELSRKIGYDESRPLYRYVYELEEQLNRHKGEASLLEELYENKDMMQLYLIDSGKSKVEPIQKEVRDELSDAEVEMNEFFIRELGENVVDEIVWDGNGTPMSYRKNYLSKYETTIRDAYKKLLSEEYQFSDEQVQNVMDSTKPADLIRFMRDANKYRQNGRVTTRTETDYEATTQAIKDAAGDGYRAWVDSLFKGVEEKSGIRNNTDFFTNSGNRRSWEALHWENNLENVVKVMKSQNNGVAAFFSGNAIWAVSAKDYRSVEEIKADAERLKQLPEEEYSEIKQGFGSRFQEIAESIMSKTESNPFIAADNAMECIIEAVRNSKTKSGILKNLKEYQQLTVTETTVDDIVSLVTDISNMPTEYFEAKPKRAVDLNEIATAIIPDNTSESTKLRLNDMGIKFVEYESGNEDARLKALNSLEDLKFSDRDSKGNTLTKEQQEFFKDSKVRDNKDRLIPVYHGTTRAFNIFTRGDVGYHFGTKGAARGRVGYSKNVIVNEVYLNITNPIVFDEDLGSWDADYRLTKELYTRGILSKEEAEHILFTDDKLYKRSSERSNTLLANVLLSKGYDGIKYPNAFETKKTTDSYIAFLPEQIKLITNTAPTSSNDIRYSDRMNESVYDKMGETERLRKDNERLKKDLGRLRERLSIEGQVKGGTAVLSKDTDLVAGHIRKIADSTFDKDNLSVELKELYTYMRESSLNGTWNEDAVFAKAYELAEGVLTEAKPKTVPNDYAKHILREIRSKRISLSETQMQEAQSAFGKNWRNSFWGKVIIANDGISLDSQWQEWASTYPDFFDADVTEGDQITALHNIYDDLRDASEIIQEYNTEEQTRWLAEEIINKCWTLPVRFTIADKYDSRIKVLNFEHRQAMKEMRDDYEQKQKEQHKVDKARYKELVQKIRDRKDSEIAEAKKHGKERLDKYKENAEKKTKIQSITANAMTLNKWLTKNSKDYRIHEAMKGPVIKLLQSLDFSSKRMIEKGIPTQNDVSFAEAFADVKAMLIEADNMVAGLEPLYGHGLAEDINTLVKVSYQLVGDNNYVINAMSLEELNILDHLVKHIKKVVTELNNFHTVHHNQGAVNLASEFVEYGDKLGKLKKQDGKIGKFLKFRNRTPYYFFKTLGNAGRKIFEAFQDGWDKLAFNAKQIIDFTEKTYTDKEVKAWSKETKEFTTTQPDGSDRTFNMSIAQIMALHCVYKQEDAQRHLLSSGMTLSRLDKKGNVIADYENISLSKSDIDAILSTLNARQIEVADKLQEFMNTVCSDWGNEISMARFAVKMFTNPDYFPIKVSASTIPTDNTKELDNASLFRLLNMSFTHSRNKYADQSIEVGDIFDIFAQHSTDMAKYNALALPVLDFNKWYSIHGKTDSNKEYGVENTLRNAFGNESVGYVKRFIKDINGSQNVSRDVLGNTFFKNAKVASVAANLRVVLLQPTAYYKASAVMKNRYLAKAGMYIKVEPIGMVRKLKKAIAKAEKYCGIVQWKTLGYYDTDISKGLTEKIKHAEGLKDKAVDKSLFFAEIADKVTFGVLWTACEFEIRDTRKDLKVGSDEFYNTVAKRLRDVIYATQIVDSTMTRSDMMRSPDRMDKMFTTFGAEPTIAYNMLADTVLQFNLDKRELGTKEAVKRNRSKVSKVLLAYTVTNAMAALIESGFDVFRDDDDEEMDIEEFLKIYFKNFAVDMSIGNKLPYVKELYSILQGYSSSRMDTQWMEHMVSAGTTWVKIFSGEGEGKGGKAIKQTLRVLSELSGIAFYNLYRDAMALLDTFDIFTSEDLEEMFDDFFS